MARNLLQYAADRTQACFWVEGMETAVLFTRDILTSRSEVNLEMLTVPQLVKFLTFYGTQKLINVSTCKAQYTSGYKNEITMFRMYASVERNKILINTYENQNFVTSTLHCKNTPTPIMHKYEDYNKSAIRHCHNYKT